MLCVVAEEGKPAGATGLASFRGFQSWEQLVMSCYEKVPVHHT